VDKDVKVLTWVTDPKPGEFSVEYSWSALPKPRTAVPSHVAMNFAKAKVKPKTSSSTPDPKKPAAIEPATTLDDLNKSITETFAPLQEREQHFIRYRAELTDLPLDSKVSYRVRLGTQLVREGTFKTRASAQKPIRFVTVGDMASNKKEQWPIAYLMSQQKAEFLVALGDIVYPGGRVLQYMNHFFPCYNDVATPGPKTGAPLLASVPLYPVIGNHDADHQKFPDYPDAYSAFYWFSVPKNGPGVGSWNLPLKDEKLGAAFRAIAGNEYPAMSHYSFDYGPAHFLVLDANSYSIKEIEKLSAWIEKDLTSTKLPWKFVCWHQPAFHTAREHYTIQGGRLLQPLFEKCGVDVVFGGHVHNYQRSKPLKFTPNPPKRDPRGRVNGTMVLDQTFDGVKDTTPEGIIHIVTGGGGATLYKINPEKTIEGLKKEHGANYIPFTEKFVSDQHSFSVVDVTPTTFELRQIGIDGAELDRFRITKDAAASGGTAGR
jgi:acid phosphatase type 7